jgi:hypothetical protein
VEEPSPVSGDAYIYAYIGSYPALTMHMFAVLPSPTMNLLKYLEEHIGSIERLFS